MIYAILMYFIWSSFFVGQYWGDVFENESVWYKIRFSFLLFVFSPTLFVLKYLFIGVGKIIPDIIKFYWRLYIAKEYDNMKPEALEFLNKSATAKDGFYLRGLKLINKRNNYTP